MGKLKLIITISLLNFLFFKDKLFIDPIDLFFFNSLLIVLTISIKKISKYKVNRDKYKYYID